MVLCRLWMLPILIIIVSLYFLSGCVWRTEKEELYFGPVWLRNIKPPQGEAHVSQQMHFPFVFEGGKQWGFSIGYQNRVIAAPTEAHESSVCTTSHSMGTNKQDWNFEWYWSTQEISFPEPGFFARTNVGLTIGLGDEANGFSLGGTRTTQLRPQKDSFHRFQYSSGNPLNTIYFSCFKG